MYDELIEEIIESRTMIIEALNYLSDLKLVFIGLFIGFLVFIIFAIVWCR